MNYLAHAYLSFNYPEILAGNMISDFVKGRKQFDYAENIQKGIVLHRAIDTFTDDHPATKAARVFFKPAVGLYSGAFVDVAYDHFLANDPNEFTDNSLQKFASDTYDFLQQYEKSLPENFRRMLPYMSEQNWLYNYKKLLGMENSFAGLARRAKYLDNSRQVFDLFKTHYDQLQKCYNTFFPSLKIFALQQLTLLNVTPTYL